MGVGDWSCPPSGLQADLAGPQSTNSPSLQGPLPHLIYRTPLLPVPFECREPGKEGKVGLRRDGCAPLTRPLPPGCLFATASRSAPLSRLRLRRKRQVWGPVQTSGCRDLRLWSRAGHPHPWLGQRAQTDVAGGQGTVSGRKPPNPLIRYLYTSSLWTNRGCLLRLGRDRTLTSGGLALSLLESSPPSLSMAWPQCQMWRGLIPSAHPSPRSAGATLQCTVRPSTWS